MRGSAGGPCRCRAGQQREDIRKRSSFWPVRESELPIVPMGSQSSITLGEGRGNAFIKFLKRGRTEIAVEARNSKEVRQPRWKLYQEAKQELRKLLEEDDRKAVFGKTERTV